VGSVLGQRGVEVDCVIVDDCSDDGTLEWLGTIDDDRVSFVRLDKHAERTVARNVGLRRARAPFVLFLDDDDLLTSTALRHQLSGLQTHPNAVVCVGRSMQLREDGRRHLAPFPRAQHPIPFVRASVLGVVFPPGQCLFRKSVVDDVGGWNEDMVLAEDQDLLMRVALKGPLVLVPEVTFINRLHSGQEPDRDDSVPASAARQRLRDAGPGLGHRIDRYIASRACLLESYAEYRAGHAFRALGLAVAAARRDPGVLVDPLTRRGSWTYILRCLVRSVPGSYSVARAARDTAASRNDR
jgi:glycosyltransferase involved in cell wall biosynthesis